MTHPTPEYVRGLLEGTTPGPWVIRTLENFGFNVVHYNGGDRFDMVRVAKCGDEANAALIAAAPSIARAYVALAERVGEMEAALVYVRENLGDPVPIGRRHVARRVDAALKLQSTREQETGQ